MENHQFGIVSTSTALDQDAPISEGAIQGVPSIEKITFFLVRLVCGYSNLYFETIFLKIILSQDGTAHYSLYLCWV